MQTWTNVSWKNISALVPGELARVRLGGGPNLVMKLEERDGHHVIGILAGARGEMFRWAALKVDPACISFGDQWFLDAKIGEEVFPDNPATHDRNATLYFGPQGFSMKFDPADSFHDSFFFLFASGTVVDHLGQGSAPISNWAIWLTEKHRLSVGSEPLLQFPPLE